MYKTIAILLFLVSCHTIMFPLSERDMNGPWNLLLKKHVNTAGMVDYSAIKNDPGELNIFLDSVKAVSKQEYDSWQQSRKLAFWINVYNALTVKVIVDDYPLESIRKIWRVFSIKRMNIVGKNMSLNDIEHNIIRPVFKDPRIHFALVCAAVSCPPLLNEAYESTKLETQLESQSEYFASSKKYFIIDIPHKTIYMSSIMKWYGADFIERFDDKSLGIASSSDRASVNFLLKYSSDIEKVSVQTGSYTVKYLKYDWSLNKQ